MHAARYLYDRDTPLAEEDANGNFLAYNMFTADGLRWRYEPSKLGDFGFYYDPQGSLIQGGDSYYGADNWGTAEYDSFGVLHGALDGNGDPEEIPGPVGFGGQYGYYTDTETGLVMMTHRYYDAGKGRFINRDPIGYGGGINLYGFVANNPVTGADPEGTTDIRKWVKTQWQQFQSFVRSPEYQKALQARGMLVMAGFPRRYSREEADQLLQQWTQVGSDPKKLMGLAQAALLQQRMIPTGSSQTTCFVAGALVQTGHGPRPIQNVKVNDEVLTRATAAHTPSGSWTAAHSRSGQHHSLASARRSTQDSEVRSTVFYRTSGKTHELETDLDLDLSEGGPEFHEELIVPASRVATLANGRKEPAQQLKPGDRIMMSAGHVGVVRRATAEWHTPATPRPVNLSGNTLNRVIGATKRAVDRLLYVYTSDDLIKTTPEHPFFVKGRGWTPAGILKPGDELETESSKGVRVSRVEVHREGATVYNLLMEGCHDFFVGSDHILVHNGGDCVPTFSKGDSIADLMRDSPYRPLHPLHATTLNEVIQEMTSGKWDWGRMDDPITIERGTGVITGGHHRIVAARALGIDIPDSAIEWVPKEYYTRPGSWSWLLLK